MVFLTIFLSHHTKLSFSKNRGGLLVVDARVDGDVRAREEREAEDRANESCKYLINEILELSKTGKTSRRVLTLVHDVEPLVGEDSAVERSSVGSLSRRSSRRRCEHQVGVGIHAEK